MFFRLLTMLTMIYLFENTSSDRESKVPTEPNRSPPEPLMCPIAPLIARSLPPTNLSTARSRRGAAQPPGPLPNKMRASPTFTHSTTATLFGERETG